MDQPETRGRLYETAIFVLLLLKSRKHNCEIGKEIQGADKFDDFGVRYEENGKTKHIFAQAKLGNNKTKVLNEKVLLGEEQISLDIHDFDIKKYFLSFLRIVNSYLGTNNVLEKLVIYTNIAQIEDELKMERNIDKNDITDIFHSRERPQNYYLKFDKISNITKALLKVKTDFSSLVDILKNYVQGKNMQMMTLNEAVLKRYRYSLFKNNVLKLHSVDEKQIKKKDNFIFCSFHEDFVNGKNEQLEDLRKHLGIIGLNDDGKKKLLEIKWKCCNGFDKFTDNVLDPLPENKPVTIEDVQHFFNILEFAVGQPDLEDINKEIGKEIQQEYFAFNYLNINKNLEEFVQNWRRINKQKEDWITNEEKNKFLNDLKEYVSNLEVISMSAKYLNNLKSIIDKYGINEQFICSEEMNLCFIESEEPVLTSIKVANFMLNEERDVIFIKDEDLLMKYGDKVSNTFRGMEIYRTMVIVCERNLYTKKIEEIINIAKELKKNLIIIGRKIEGNQNWSYLKDRHLIHVEDLERKEEVMKKELVWQGNKIVFKDVVNDSRYLDQLVSSTILRKLIFNETIECGDGLIFSDMNGVKYIDRTLKKPVLENGLFKESGKFQEDLFIINGDESIFKKNFPKTVIGEFNITFSSGEKEFKKICKENEDKNVHLLIYENNCLLWKFTHGSNETLSKFIKTVKDYKNSFPEVMLHTEIDSHQFCIINGETGIGKSCILNNIYKQYHYIDPSYIVIRFNLNECIEYFQQIDKIDINDLLLKLIEQKRADEFGKKIAMHNVKNHEKLILLFDSFDEVYNDYGEAVLHFFNILNNTNITKIIITSRPNVVNFLEKQLSIFSYEMNEFNDNDRKLFLINFFQNELQINPNNSKLTARLITYVVHILFLLNNSIKDKEKSLTGIPLLLMLLGKTFVKTLPENQNEFQSCEEFLNSNNDTPKLPENLNLIYLYEKCLKSYFYEWCLKIELHKNLRNQKYFDSIYKEFLKLHEMYSTLVFFYDNINIFSFKEDIKNNFNNDFKEMNEGIIIRNINGRPQYLHQSFAEYFFVKFVINKILDNASNELKVFILESLLTNNIYENIRLFLNGLLKNERNQNAMQDSFKYLVNSKLANEQNLIQNILLKAIEENNDEILCFIFDCIDDRKTFIEETKFFNKVFYTVLNCNCYKSTIDIIAKYCNINIKSQYSINEFIEMLLKQGVDCNQIDVEGNTVLIKAVLNSNVELVELLLNYKADCNIFNIYKKVALLYAVQNNNKHIVDLLLQNGANANFEDKDWNTPLHLALDCDNIEIVELLLKHDANIHFINTHGHSPLYKACLKQNDIILNLFINQLNNCKNTECQKFKECIHKAILKQDIATVNQLLENDFDLNVEDENKHTPIFLAIFVQNESIITCMLNNGADCNKKDNTGWTPLYYAVKLENESLIKLLLNYNANYNIQLNSGWTPLYEACDYQNKSLIKIFAENLNCQSIECKKHSCIHKAILNEDINSINELYKNNFDFNSYDENKDVPLILAIFLKNIEIIQLLLSFNIKINGRNNLGITPLFTAVETLDRRSVELLLDSGADCNIQDDDGFTPLHRAVHMSNKEIIQLLLDNNADCNIIDKRNRTPIDIAREKTIRDLLLNYQKNKM